MEHNFLQESSGSLGQPKQELGPLTAPAQFQAVPWGIVNHVEAHPGADQLSPRFFLEQTQGESRATFGADTLVAITDRQVDWSTRQARRVVL